MLPIIANKPTFFMFFCSIYIIENINHEYPEPGLAKFLTLINAPATPFDHFLGLCNIRDIRNTRREGRNELVGPVGALFSALRADSFTAATMPQVLELLILHDTTARRNDDIQDAREGHHILDNAPHGRSDGPGALDGAEELRGGAEVEAAGRRRSRGK
jgi:hypothetical protein